METYKKQFTNEGGKHYRRVCTLTVINNEIYIVLKNCKPRPLYRDRLHEPCFYLKKGGEKVYLGY